MTDIPSSLYTYIHAYISLVQKLPKWLQNTCRIKCVFKQINLLKHTSHEHNGLEECIYMYVYI